MMADEKQEAVMLGIRNAWDFSLSQHEISVPQAIEDSVKATFRQWLDDNRADVLAAIAKGSTPTTPKADESDQLTERDE